MDQILNNLRIIEGKILSLQAEGKEEEALAWKENAAHQIAQLQRHFAELGRPLSPMAQLYKNGLELQG